MLIAIVILIVDRLRDHEPVAEEAEAKRASQDAASAEDGKVSNRILTGCCLALSLSPVSPRWFMKMLGRARSPWLSAARSIRLRPCWSRFSIGLALGGFFYARVLGDREARLSTFGLLELWVGLSALATIPLFERLPLIFVRLLHGFGDTFTVFLYLQIFLSALVMFIPTILLGMTFPLVARFLPRACIALAAASAVPTRRIQSEPCSAPSPAASF